MKTILIMLFFHFASLFSQNNLGNQWEVKEKGHFNELWVKSESQDKYSSEYFDSNGNKIKTLNEVLISGNEITIQRIYSSNGEFCTIKGILDKTKNIIKGLCTYPLSKVTNKWEATIIIDENDTLNLTGVWKCNDNGTYYIRQKGDSLVWFGEQNKENKEFSNIAFGIIKEDLIYLSWYDVPKGTILGNGSLLLIINNRNKLVKKAATGDFGGYEWEKIK